MKFLIVFFLLIITSCSIVGVSKEGTEGIRFSVDLRDGIIDVIINYGPGRRAWAESLIIPTIETLQGIESYLDISMPITQDIRIRTGDDAFLGSKKVNGYNSVFEIGLDYDVVTKEDLTTLIHELIHYWANSSVFNQDWLVEGLATFLPYVLAVEGYIRLSSFQIDKIKHHYNYVPNRVFPEGIFPSNFSNGSEQPFFYYEKIFDFHMRLYNRIKPIIYQIYVRNLFQNPPATVSQAILILNIFYPDDWNSLLSGWLFEGPYDLSF